LADDAELATALRSGLAERLRRVHAEERAALAALEAAIV
jgi:hypothetical protein